MAHMGKVRHWAIRIVEAVFTTAIGHGILLWLASKEIHPDRWVASMIQATANTQITEAAWWVIAGIFGVVCTFLMEYGTATWQRRHSISTNQPATEQPSQPAERGSTGIRYAGGSMQNVLIEGYQTGIDEIHAPVDGLTIRRHQFSGAMFTKDGRFKNLSNQDIMDLTRETARQLRSLNDEYEVRSGPNLSNLSDAVLWRNKEFEDRYRVMTAQLAGEVLSRIEPIQVNNMSPVSFGGGVIYTGKLDGMDPLRFASYFLDYIADRLPSIPS
jgi:hypothetical protein